MNIIPTAVLIEPTLTTIRSMALGPVRLVLAIVILALLFCYELVRAIWGRWRHGRTWEPGDGIGHREDYE